MIFEAKGKPQEGEERCWTVAVGNAPMPWHSRKVKKEAEAVFKYIKELELEGFLGVIPMYPRGTLLIFRTEDEAKRAKNRLDAMGVITGSHICEVFVKKEYLKQDKEGEEKK